MFGLLISLSGPEIRQIRHAHREAVDVGYAQKQEANKKVPYDTTARS